MVSVYVLYSEAFDQIYIGMSNNVEKRLQQHNSGQNKSTKAYIPWVVIHAEPFEFRHEARLREKYLKSYRGRKKIRSLYL